MIISASRRTDIPAFYSEWFMNRVRAGYCTVPNPFNPAQVSRVSLKAPDVDCVVFWTRNPAPMLPHLRELEERGIKSLFLHTLLDNPKALDPACPKGEKAIKGFLRLAEIVGPERVVWRYDPIVFSNVTDHGFHCQTFARLARELEGHTARCIVSVLDVYRKARKRLAALEEQGVRIHEPGNAEMRELMAELSGLARERSMALQSCAQEADWTAQGVPPGACVDHEYLSKYLGLEIDAAPDTHQRPHCRCSKSRDIGMYDSCVFGCAYCYATTDFSRSRRNHALHDPASPSLLGWHETQPEPERQLGLWEDAL